MHHEADTIALINSPDIPSSTSMISRITDTVRRHWEFDNHSTQVLRAQVIVTSRLDSLNLTVAIDIHHPKEEQATRDVVSSLFTWKNERLSVSKKAYAIHSRTNLRVSTASMSLNHIKQLYPLEMGELPLTATPSIKRHHGSAPRSRLGSSLFTVIKYSIPAIYLVYLLSRDFVFTVPRVSVSNVKYSSTSPAGAYYDDPASEFKDDVFPLRPQDTWDISTDFPYPRTLAYDVEEGTWLRLDVHPISGDIVFDMAGDIYCLPAHSYSDARLTSGIKTKAVPVLTGVPHDADPSFSPEGDRLAFRSDAGLGVDNIWVMPWATGGCSEMDLRTPSAMTAEVIAQRVHDASLLAQGVRETEERRLRRLSQEGRLEGLCLDNYNPMKGSDSPRHV